jgi:hypothetical protein
MTLMTCTKEGISTWSNFTATPGPPDYTPRPELAPLLSKSLELLLLPLPSLPAHWPSRAKSSGVATTGHCHWPAKPPPTKISPCHSSHHPSSILYKPPPPSSTPSWATSRVSNCRDPNLTSNHSPLTESLGRSAPSVSICIDKHKSEVPLPVLSTVLWMCQEDRSHQLCRTQAQRNKQTKSHHKFKFWTIFFGISNQLEDLN